MSHCQILILNYYYHFALKCLKDCQRYELIHYLLKLFDNKYYFPYQINVVSKFPLTPIKSLFLQHLGISCLLPQFTHSVWKIVSSKNNLTFLFYLRTPKIVTEIYFKQITLPNYLLAVKTIYRTLNMQCKFYLISYM